MARGGNRRYMYDYKAKAAPARLQVSTVYDDTYDSLHEGRGDGCLCVNRSFRPDHAKFLEQCLAPILQTGVRHVGLGNGEVRR